MIRQILTRTVTSCFIVTVMFATASAGTIFNDIFFDGNADFPEAQWTPVPEAEGGPPGNYDASSGDYVFSPVVDTGSSMVSEALDHTLTDTSIRSQVRVSESDAFVGLYARVQDDERRKNYLAGAFYDSASGGTIFFMGRGSGDGGFVSLGLSDSQPFDVRNEDVVLQFDVIGNELKLWGWQAGGPVPDQPIFAETDDTYSEGYVALIGAIGAPRDNISTFRLVHLADKHIADSDFDFSGGIDDTDIDLELRAIHNGSTDPLYDLNGSTTVDSGDGTHLIETLLGTHFGDADLSGSVTGSGDGAILLANLGGVQGNKGWADADFDGDQNVTASADGAVLLTNLGNDGAAIPEPDSLLLIGLGSVLLAFWKRPSVNEKTLTRSGTTAEPGGTTVATDRTVML